MSLLNAWVNPSAAIVVTDTAGLSADGGRTIVTKCLPLPHLGAAVALRGRADFFYLFAMHCLAEFSTFDALLHCLPAKLAQVDDEIPDVDAAVGEIGGEVVIAGWSNRQQQMLGRAFVKCGREYTVREIGCHISPWDDSLADAPVVPQAVSELASRQVAWMRKTYPGAYFGCGGELMLCHIDRNRIAIGPVLNLDEKR